MPVVYSLAMVIQDKRAELQLLTYMVFDYIDKRYQTRISLSISFLEVENSSYLSIESFKAKNLTFFRLKIQVVVTLLRKKCLILGE